MGLSQENTGPLKVKKIPMYLLTRAELLYTLCNEIPCISHWISLAVATSFGVILGYVVGKHSEKKNTCIATKEKPEASEKDEVLFFPDSQTYAGKYGCDNCV